MTRAALVAVALSFFTAGALAQAPLGTAFTYQGRLTDGGAPASGVYDLQVTLFDAAAGGAQVPGTPIVSLNDVQVTGGLFTVNLDFGATAFAGSKRWLVIGIRPGASMGAYTLLAARQELTATPNSVFSQTVPWTGVSGKPAGFADNVDDDTGVNAVTNGGGITGSIAGRTLTLGSDSTVQRRTVPPGCPGGQFLVAIAPDGSPGCAPAGDITQVIAGPGLLGGASSGDAFLTLDFGGSGNGTAPTPAHSDHNHHGQVWSGNAADGLFIANGGGNGVHGITTAGSSSGVIGETFGGAGTYGVFGRTDSSAGYAGYFDGPLFTTGILQMGLPTEFSAFRFGAATSRHHLISNRDMVFNAFDTDGVLNGSSVFLWRRDGNKFDETVTADLMRIADNGRLTVLGDAVILGTLSKGAGSFKIDHPLDPENKYLYHSFVESPDMKNIYDGVVTTDGDGFATVEMPDWFDALNRDFRYQLTVIGQFAQAIVARRLEENRFVIQTDKPEVEVSWQVTGIRKDPFAEKHRIPVEEDKPENERGAYLHPTEWGQPESKGIESRPSSERRPIATLENR